MIESREDFLLLSCRQSNDQGSDSKIKTGVFQSAILMILMI